jgi:hypothetical protein
VPGAGIVAADQLADGVHPGDAGHIELARVIGPAVANALNRVANPGPLDPGPLGLGPVGLGPVGPRP